MVHKRDADAPAPEVVVPELAPVVAPADLVMPAGLDFAAYDFGRRGSRTASTTTRSARRSTTSTA
jgi:2-methylfumaryl-CoA hydratase